MSSALIAGAWGLLAGSALVIGAAGGYGLRISPRLIAMIMAFGSGVLISTVAFELMAGAYERAGLVPAVLGAGTGALAFTLANRAISHAGARHRKRSQGQQSAEKPRDNAGLALAVGSLLDGVPESIAIGVSVLAGGSVSWVMVVGIFLSNLPEGLSSSAGMRRAGRGAGYVFGLWGGIAAISGLAAWLGYVVFGKLPVHANAATSACAAGAVLAMVSETMIPEAFEEARDFAGLVVVAGFLVAFGLSHAGS